MSEHEQLIDNQEPKRLFVYGTLSRRVNPNAHRWGGTLMGLGSIPGVMYDHGAFPATVPHPHGNVVGEVISFEGESDEYWLEVLEAIDAYEGVPYLYYRDLIHVTMEDESQQVAWVYLYTDKEAVKGLELIPSGDWEEWTNAARFSSITL
jgi:gamma-glutamylcyclotransferase (GGCT)/AIG2-like uncharacterized protein YtfP